MMSGGRTAPLNPVRVEKAALFYNWSPFFALNTLNVIGSAVTLLLLPVTSWIYAAVAVLIGAWFVFSAHRLHHDIVAGHDVTPMKLFHLSNAYLCALFAAIAVDAAVGLPVLF